MVSYGNKWIRKNELTGEDPAEEDQQADKSDEGTEYRPTRRRSIGIVVVDIRVVTHDGNRIVVHERCAIIISVGACKWIPNDIDMGPSDCVGRGDVGGPGSRFRSEFVLVFVRILLAEISQELLL